MGGGLTFLSKKSFNPSNIANQRRVWEARQQSESERRRLVEREAQIKREREEEELARVIGGEEEGGRKALGFMYEAGKVPGLKKEGNCNNNDYDQHEKTNNVANDEGNLFQRQPGDDDAAAAFRAMLAQGVPNGDTDMQERNQHCQPVAEINTADEDTADNSNNEPSSRDNRTKLEKAVGRGINSGSGVTLAQQMERFPMLKAAPKVLQKQRNNTGESEQASANDVAAMNFKPLGQVIRNVQCMACKKWGHARGERECELSGWNPFQMSAPPAAATSSITTMNAADITSSTEAAPNITLQQRDEGKEGEITTLKSERKHSKKRHKGDRKKKSKKHNRRRRRERSPSYSDSDDSSSYSSEEERYRKKRRRDYSSDESYDRRRSRKKERRKKSSRK
jgi:CBF1 interacting corepressor